MWGIIGVLITILILIGNWLYNRLKDPIVVSPKEIIHKSKQWDERVTFNVFNRTEKMLYSIWVKLLIIDTNVKPEDIEIESEFGDKFNPIDLGNISIDFDIIRFDCLDSIKKECIYLLLRNLSSKEPKSLLLNLKSKINNDELSTSKINLKIYSYSKEAPRLLTQKDQIAYPFKPPENIKFKSIYLLMKRD